MTAKFKRFFAYLSSLGAEFLASAMFMFIATYLSTMTKDPKLIALAWGAALPPAYCFFNWLKAGHVNSGVTAGMWTGGEVRWYTTLPFWLVQTPASVAGILLASRVATGEFNREFAGKIIARPADGIDLWKVALVEGAGVFILTLVVLATGKVASWKGKLPVGIVLGVVLGALVYVAGKWTGGAINPSRALAPWLLALPESGLRILVLGYVLPGLAGGALAGVVGRVFSVLGHRG